MTSPAVQKKNQAVAEETASKNGNINEQLMRQMGSQKGYDPIPPDQYLFFLNDRDPLQRLLAFVRAKTIRQGHRSPHCVDEHGRAITLEQIAVYFGWSMKHARCTWTEAEQKGLVGLDGHGRLRLRGDVPLPAAPEECKQDEEKTCTGFFPKYVTEQFQQLTENKKAQLQLEYPLLEQFNSKVTADAMALARAIIEERQAQFFARYGIEIRRNKKQRENDGQELVQVSLNELSEEFVQIFENPVQDDSANLYNAKNGSVQDSHPLYTETEKSRVSQSVSVVEESAPATEATTDRLTDIASSIPASLLEELDELPTPELLDRITKNLDGAPPEKLTKRIHRRYAAITSLGLIADLAKDVGQEYLRTEAKRKAAAIASAARAAPTKEAIEEARKTLDDPASTEHEREFAKELLGPHDPR